MLKNGYKYVLMMYRSDETALGQVALDVDWEPARECAEFEAVRRGILLGCEIGVVSSAHPLWHPKLGEPYTQGFSVNVKADSSESVSANFTSSYFKAFAAQASAHFVKEGKLKGGDSFFYVIAAFPQEDEKPDAPTLSFTVEEITSPLPLKETRFSDFVSEAVENGEIATGAMPVFVPQRVLDEAARLSREAGAKETGGILVGYLHRDSSVPEVFIEVTAQLPARHTKAELTKLTFTPETWTDVRAALELRRRGEIMLGWWHSHPAREWCKDCSTESQRECKMARDFFSAHDHALHRARSLGNVPLHVGDQVRWDRAVWMAFEKIERSKGTDLFLEETPQETFDSVGGLDRQIEELQRGLRLHMQHAATVRKYQLRRKGSVLLVGPPGTGKTMMARSLANWLARNSKCGRSRFMNIKPASLHSMWYAQSEANYREAFRVAREAGEQEPDVPVVMFFDEIDAIGGARGQSLMRVNDRVLTAFMCELDGLEARGNILVVGATNRRDALDPALLRPGRLGDSVIEVPRPNMRAAREIFSKHLSASIPYAVDGHGADVAATRQAIIDSAVSRIYSPNGENELATLTLRDGKRRTVRAADLISGASIAKVALAATESACVREIEMGRAGIELEGMLSAIADEFEALARTLSPANCHQHLNGLPQDVDVVSVEPALRKVSRPHKYLRVA